uniref:VWFA and cache domain-containing protein 1 n=1 Tax=Magallana gigas TaxID=29159 RepID=K1RDU8_MAGGI
MHFEKLQPTPKNQRVCSNCRKHLIKRMESDKENTQGENEVDTYPVGSADVLHKGWALNSDDIYLNYEGPRQEWTHYLPLAEFGCGFPLFCMRSLEFIQHEIPPYILGKDFDMATIKVLVLACLVSPSLAKINADILAGELNRVMEDIGYKKLQVDFDSMCVSTSGISSREKKYPTNNGILNTMKSNHKKNPSLLWQYVGFENGILINYPATKLSHCSSYDPRFRPFYKEGVSPMPKEVVIAVDASKSMTGDRFQKAKDAVHRVLESLGSTDRIGIVMFNEKAYRPEKDVQPCYGRNLAVVTQKTKAVLRSFVNSQTTKGNTNYSLAFEAAFNYFMSSGNTITASDKVILFVSDGDNLDGDNALTVIRDRNEQLGNSVVIHTFAIGSLSDSAESLLRNISKQTKNNDDHGATQTGRYQRVTNLNHLPEAVGSFYSYSNNAISPKPIFTKPYVDFFSNIGLIVSMCLPCTSNSNFIGVVCTDIKLKDLVEDTTYLQQGEDTYSFVIDGTGRTLIHPLLPDPRDSNANEYDVDDIDNFETGGNVKEVIESMKLGLAGSKEINTTVAQVRGKLLLEGDNRTRMRAIYQWQQIAALNSILATEKVDSIWKNNQRKTHFILWRFLATEAGVVRIYPGLLTTTTGELAKKGDHSHGEKVEAVIAGDISEGIIAKSLIKENIMFKQPCLSVESQKEQMTYRNSEKSPNVVRCTSAPCDCLCYRPVNYNECENKYNATEKHIPCSAAPPVLMTNPIKEDNLIRNLPACFDIDCSCKDNQLIFTMGT